MKREVENWTIGKLFKERGTLAFPEYQREKSLWPKEKKSLLIDSILTAIDIPKLYFNRIDASNIEVIDGQQRLWAIWEFLDGMYSYEHGTVPKKYSELSASQQDKIKDYILQITVFDNADDDYLRELFVRLQLGLLLNTGEKLNASSGEMKNLVFTTMNSHPFIKSAGIPSRRFAKQTLSAQICINSFSRAKLQVFCRTRYEDLAYFFTEYSNPIGQDRAFFDANSLKIIAVLDELWACFKSGAKALKNRSYILSLYLFLEERLGNQAFSKNERIEFVEFVSKLWTRMKEEIRRGVDRKNKELYTFETFLSSAPGERYQIERRHQKLNELYEYFKKEHKILGD